MSNRTLAAVLVVFIAAAVHEDRRAEACHETFETASAAVFLGTVVVALPFTLHDLAVDHSSRRYAAFEAVFMGATAIANAGLILGADQTCEGGMFTAGAKGIHAGTGIWAMALMAHGIYELVTERGTPVTPTVVSDGEHVGAGVAWIGRF